MDESAAGERHSMSTAVGSASDGPGWPSLVLDYRSHGEAMAAYYKRFIC